MNEKEFFNIRKKIMQRDFARMNDKQKEAIFHTEGPLLILAGAGSGKTTVLVNRIACIVKYGKAYHDTTMTKKLSDQDIELLEKASKEKINLEEMKQVAEICAVNPCPPWRILAITFTNKAADELKERIIDLLGDTAGNEVFASTFHSFCSRVLRQYADRIGYSSSFAIYDADDSRRLMKDCLKQLNIDEKILGHRAVLNEISSAKDNLIGPKEFSEQAAKDYRLKQVSKCYDLYQQRLIEADAMDFDDLIFQTVTLFQHHKDILQKYQERFKYMMVDEYQDTNHAQYVFISLLAEKNENLCVVGDDDQSIYKFRGATIENILSFEEQYPKSKVIRLEQNYRSTQTILQAANAVISNNVGRKQKTLWTDNDEGEKIEVHTLPNQDEEGRFITELVHDGVVSGRNYGDYAVLYRANAQSNSIERSFVKSAVPYRIIGGHRFYERQEIRDAMAYLRVINNPADEISLKRIINQPKRGIGTVTMERANGLAYEQATTLYDVLIHIEEYADLSRAVSRVTEFTEIIESLREMTYDDETPLHLIYTTMLEKTGYLEMWKSEGEAEISRVDNLKELESSIIDYENNSIEDVPSLSGFLEEVALMTDIDNYEEDADAVVLMTMHAAKGLEFPVVILPGFEDGVFPGQQTINESGEMEEDRRLCYVALTRAKEEIYILNAQSRMLYGSTTRNRPSRFLREIPSEHKENYSQLTSFNVSESSDFYQSDLYKGSWADISAQSYRSTPTTIAGSALTQDSDKWETGDKVEHKVFGVGEILSAKSMGNDFLLEIEFNGYGIKRIMANFAKMKKV